jgi:hypothetical protein
LCPGFFPNSDQSFDLQLPNRGESVSAKICQAGDKALMTKPNNILGTWLIGVLHPNIQDWQFEEAPADMTPITYNDLLRIQKDSVRVVKQQKGGKEIFAIEFAPIGSYEEFLETT